MHPVTGPVHTGTVPVCTFKNQPNSMCFFFL